MGQKVHPIGMRLGYIKDWTSRWFAESKDYPELLYQDLTIRAFIKQKLKHASVSRIQINRPANNAQITVHTARPGIVIGKKGEDIDALRRQVSSIMGIPVHMNVEEIRKPELDAQLVAEGVAQQLEKRIMFRRAMKRAVTNTMRLGAEGIRINVQWALEWSGNRTSRVVSGGACPFAYPAGRHRLWFRGSGDHLRHYWCKGVDL